MLGNSYGADQYPYGEKFAIMTGVFSNPSDEHGIAKFEYNLNPKYLFAKKFNNFRNYLLRNLSLFILR